MQIRLMAILVLLVTGAQANFAWLSFGCGCSVCADVSACSPSSAASSSCATGQIQQDEHADGHADGHGDEHGRSTLALGDDFEPPVQDGSSLSAACTCSMHPSDAPKPAPKQPLILQEFSPFALIGAPVQPGLGDELWDARLDGVGSSLDRDPPSNSLRQALLSVWRT